MEEQYSTETVYEAEACRRAIAINCCSGMRRASLNMLTWTTMRLLVKKSLTNAMW